MEEKLDSILVRHEELGARLASGDLAGSDFAGVSKEFSDLETVVAVIRALREAKKQYADLEEMLSDADGDADMKAMAEEERLELSKELPELENQLQVALIPKDKIDEKNAILEVRAGAGGDEAGLFAAELFRMYQRYASEHGWKFEVLSESSSGVGGYKEASATITGTNVFARLKFESGVHRVQRVPSTETQGRVHTSAATVAVLPEAEEVDIEVRQEDIRIDTMRASGAGGQHVNTTDSAVRITHLPSGIMVTSSEKSQHQNRRNAMAVLRARLYEMERDKADAERSASRKGQVGSGDRSERIRTYNFPQGRITDHRINLTMHNIDKFMEGDLDNMIDSLTAEDQAQKMAEISE